MSDGSVLVHTTADAMQAEILAEVLGAEGIEVEVVGPRNAALLGAAAHIVPLSLRVAAAQAEEARALIASVLGEPEAPSRDARSAQDGPATAEGPASISAARVRLPKRRVVAVGAALVVPGGSHYYIDRPWTGLVLTVSFAAALMMLVRSAGSRGDVAAGAVTLVALVVADLLGGAHALRRPASREAIPARSRLRQLVTGVLFAAASFGLGSVLGPQLPPPKPQPGDADLELLRLWQEQEQARRRREGAAPDDGGVGTFRLFDPGAAPRSDPARSPPTD